MKSSLLAAALWLAATCAAAAQANDATIVSAEQVEQIRAAASAAQAPTAPAMSRPIIAAEPYTLSLEHRTGKAPALPCQARSPKSRSVSTARNAGRTSTNAQPSIPAAAQAS